MCPFCCCEFRERTGAAPGTCEANAQGTLAKKMQKMATCFALSKERRNESPTAARRLALILFLLILVLQMSVRLTRFRLGAALLARTEEHMRSIEFL